MSEVFEKFKKDSEAKSFDLKHRKTIKFNISKYDAAVIKGKKQYRDLELAKRRAANLKHNAINKLDDYLIEFEANFVRRGGKVIWADDGETAIREILTILRKFDARKVVKQKSMVTEELELNHALEKHNIEMDSLFDFMSWYSFNWSFPLTPYSTAASFGHLPDELDKKKWVQENHLPFFNSEEYQYWYLGTIGTDLRSGTSANMYKYSAKKYIYDFNHDEEYFINKLKVKSISAKMIPAYKFAHKLYAVDTDYNFYYQQSPQTPWPKL